jgi:hypothetical protein
MGGCAQAGLRQVNIERRGQELEQYYTRLFRRHWLPPLAGDPPPLSMSTDRIEAEVARAAVVETLQLQVRVCLLSVLRRAKPRVACCCQWLAAVVASGESVVSIESKAATFFSQIEAMQVAFERSGPNHHTRATTRTYAHTRPSLAD